MNRTRHTGGQIIRKLQTADLLIALGKTVDDVCRECPVSIRLMGGVNLVDRWKPLP